MKIAGHIFRLSFFAFMTTSLVNCAGKISEHDSVIRKLYGTWDWVESSGGFDGGTITPAKAGFHKSIEFNIDGIYTLSIDGIEKEKTEFSLSKEKSIYASSAWTVKYGTSTEKRSNLQSIKFGGKDTLFLSDECYDCYRHIYTRKR
jgi:hypothetical protein